MVSVGRQKELFESIHKKYYDATTDHASERYKEQFIYEWLERELAPAASLIELASGTGAASGWLRSRRPSLEIAGCDISESAARDYTSEHGAPCHVWDLTKSIEVSRTYDAALVLGGIHHLVADLPTAFSNISRLLNPGGRLVMMEPNADFLLEPLRRIWYRCDTSHFDAANEHALSHKKLFEEYGGEFNLSKVKYIGGPGYFIILQNWVLRIPGKLKSSLSPAFMAIDSVYHALPGESPYPAFLACWVKKS